MNAENSGLVILEKAEFVDEETFRLLDDDIGFLGKWRRTFSELSRQEEARERVDWAEMERRLSSPARGVEPLRLVVPVYRPPCPLIEWQRFGSLVGYAVVRPYFRVNWWDDDRGVKQVLTRTLTDSVLTRASFPDHPKTISSRIPVIRVHEPGRCLGSQEANAPAPAARPSNLQLLLRGSEDAPRHKVFDDKLMERRVLADVLNVWLFREPQSLNEYRVKRKADEAESLENEHAAVSFVLMDARFAFSLSPLFERRRADTVFSMDERLLRRESKGLNHRLCPALHMWVSRPVGEWSICARQGPSLPLPIRSLRYISGVFGELEKPLVVSDYEAFLLSRVTRLHLSDGFSGYLPDWLARLGNVEDLKISVGGYVFKGTPAPLASKFPAGMRRLRLYFCCNGFRPESLSRWVGEVAEKLELLELGFATRYKRRVIGVRHLCTAPQYFQITITRDEAGRGFCVSYRGRRGDMGNYDEGVEHLSCQSMAEACDFAELLLPRAPAMVFRAKGGSSRAVV